MATHLESSTARDVWIENEFPHRFVGCFARDRFDNEPGDNVPDGVIRVLGSRYVLRPDAERPIDDFLRVHGNIEPVADHKVEAGVKRVFSETVSVVSIWRIVMSGA